VTKCLNESSQLFVCGSYDTGQPVCIRLDSISTHRKGDLLPEVGCCVFVPHQAILADFELLSGGTFNTC